MSKRIKQIFIILILLVSGLFGFLLSLYLHQDTSPVQQMDTLRMQTFHYPATFVKQLAGDPDAGRKIFNEFCGACHSEHPAIDVKAPLIGDKKSWGKLRSWGEPALLKITIRGVGAMPARGGCFECSDEQLRVTIKYILNKS